MFWIAGSRATKWDWFIEWSTVLRFKGRMNESGRDRNGAMRMNVEIILRGVGVIELRRFRFWSIIIMCVTRLCWIRPGININRRRRKVRVSLLRRVKEISVMRRRGRVEVVERITRTRRRKVLMRRG